MIRPCHCDRIPAPLTAEFVRGVHCGRCTLWARGQWSVSAPPPPRPCVYLGDQLTGREREANGLDHRRVWSLCTHPAQPKGRHVCPCKGCGTSCPGYDDGTPKPVPKRHALMHILPVSGNGVWQRSVAQLAARRGLFDGRVVIAVATGSAKKPLDSADRVRLAAPWADVIEVPNDPNRREVATWRPLWERLTPHLSPVDAVLYCHSKGATRNVDPGNSCHWWGSLMWSVCLDHWPLVERQLKTHPITGPFLKLGYGFGPGAGKFHYSGTFFWLKAGDFLTRRRHVAPPEQWWGVEAWPGVAYDPGEAACLFLSGKVPGLDLYSRSYWAGVVLPERAKWLRANPPAWPWMNSGAVGSGVAGRSDGG
jgi:hypothetical protein